MSTQKKTNFEILKELQPEVVKAFGEMSKTLYSTNHLPDITKEFIAVGLAAVQRCKPCLKAHLTKAIKLGATYEQALEAASTAIGFGGGPVYMTVMNDVIDILNELTNK
ncbi:carboxymuconolactone decarboxylase family protein [Mycoplasmopsis columbina]|uniref:Alkylhydroperoxidase like protein n=1 Tax=Mycoplasmopsis columbina SF7 TaxID=1037410 RepID=F9UJI8_9BACT|nr:carboxymuconolactone decarboxylase family protein [Mycoplasmopsis columbina]EGV00369.1 alkylhydroperoxidase like protein [Mycoplasmopsis columbina SF7]VEU76768.1 alkylhydroperoxidase AhpD family core domain [Mycoplasmopsis columbina]